MFNLSNHIQDFIDYFVIKYSARGYTHQKHREPYTWWDYDELASGQAANMDVWNQYVAAEPSLTGALNEAEMKKIKSINNSVKNYKLPPEIARQTTKTYLGYSPAYGAYIVNIAPYFSKGERWGIEHKTQEAVGRFNFYPLRQRKATPEEINASVAGRIDKFMREYGSLVDLTPEDFSLDIAVKQVEDKEKFQNKRDEGLEIRGKYTHTFLPTLDPNSQQVQDFYKNAPLQGVNSKIMLNGKGYIKILRAYLGPWYEQTMNEKMQAENKTEEQVATEMLTNPKIVQSIYKRAMSLWEAAKQAGDPAALAIGKVPQYYDKTLNGKSGAQSPTASGKAKRKEIKDEQGNVINVEVIPAQKTKPLLADYALKKEVLEALHRIRQAPAPVPAGAPAVAQESEAKRIADIMNKDPERVQYNRSRYYSQRSILKQIDLLKANNPAGVEDPEITGKILDLTEQARRKEQVWWTEQDIEIVLSGINEQARTNPEAEVASITTTMEKLVSTSGFDDMKTAFDMAKAYFSGLRQDVKGAKMGTAGSVIFNPPENFHNFTSDDLAKYVQGQVVIVDEDTAGGMEGEDKPATPEDIQARLGDIDVGPEKAIPAEVTPDVPAVPDEVKGVEVPVGEGAEIEKTPEQLEKEKEEKQKELDTLLGHTLRNLVKIAEDLDKDGKDSAAEEVHKVIRKYQERL